MPKVSIVIPFNNVENYIDECLNCVVNQTLSDIEIILINDASTDKSRDIVISYAEKDDRFKLIEINERKGQGFARNRGIEIATGEYIGFVDSDDFIEPNMFELLYNSAKENDTDITMCQVREYDDINENFITSDYYSLASLAFFENNTFSAKDTKNQILDINVALWNKVYKREYLVNLGEKFPEGFIYEDLPFFFGTYLPAKRINIVWKNLYSYRVNRKNSTMQQFNNKILDRLPMVSLTYEKLKQVPYLNDLKQKIQGWIIDDLFHRYSLLKENYHKEFFFLMKKVFQSLEIKNINDDFWNRVYHFQGYLLVVNNSFEDFNNKVFTEYLDIHKVEDRLRSQITSNKEIDGRFDLLYEDLGKTYKYTEELVSNLSNEMKDELKHTYNDIRDLSFVVQDNFVELNKEQDYIKEQNKKLVEEINTSIHKNKELVSSFKEETKIYLDSKMQEISSVLKLSEKEIYREITLIREEIALEKEQQQKALAELKLDFVKTIELQEQKHQEAMQELKNQMLQMQSDLREEMKSPIKKFIEKYQNKLEK